MLDGIRVSDSLKDTSRNLKLDCLEVYRRYCMEGLLARLQIADIDGRMMLKGGLVWWLQEALKDDARPTSDIDIHFHSKEDHKGAKALFKRAQAVEIDDGLRFELGRVSKLEHTGEHEGLRVVVEAFFKNTNPTQDTRNERRVGFHVDVGFGGRRPEYAVEQEFKRLHKNAPNFRLTTVPTEYIVAEKFSAIVKLGSENTRLKDYNDLFVIATKKNLDTDRLGEAIAKTFEDRHQVLPEDTCDIEGLGLNYCVKMADQWRAWLKSTRRQEKMPDGLLNVVRTIDEFLMTALRGAHGYRKDLEHTFKLTA
jgi:hypothetical protein